MTTLHYKHIHINQLGTFYIKTPIWKHKMSYPFGSVIPGRSWSEPSLSATYKYGFNGKEKVDEIEGDGNAYDFGARIYDNRLGRWMSLDPLESEYAGISPYVFVANMPLIAIDPTGEKIVIVYKDANGVKQRYVYQPGVACTIKNDFVEQTVAALEYNRKADPEGLVDQISAHKKTVNIHQVKHGKNDYADRWRRRITWAPRDGTNVADDEDKPTGKIQTPALALYHELGHFKIFWFYSFRKKWKLNQERVDSKWENAHEKEVIEQIENPQALRLNLPIRTNHYGTDAATENSTSTSKKVDDKQSQPVKKGNPGSGLHTLESTED